MKGYQVVSGINFEGFTKRSENPGAVVFEAKLVLGGRRLIRVLQKIISKDVGGGGYGAFTFERSKNPGRKAAGLAWPDTQTPSAGSQ